MQNQQKYTKNVLNSKLFNFVTLWKLIKAPQNLVQGPSSIKFRKYALKTRIKICLQFPFNPSLPDPGQREKINPTPFFSHFLFSRNLLRDHEEVWNKNLSRFLF